MGILDALQQMSTDDLRNEVIGLLKQAYADGRIAVETLERRLTEATNAGDKETLLSLVADIPSSEKGRGQTANAQAQSQPEPEDGGEWSWTINPNPPKDRQNFFAVLGGSDCSGSWQAAEDIGCFALLGGITLDFRQASFPPTGVTINVGVVLGGVDIILPPGINVTMSGIPLLGGFDNKAGDGANGAPDIRVKGVAILGGVDIKRKESKKSRRRAARDKRKERRHNRRYS